MSRPFQTKALKTKCYNTKETKFSLKNWVKLSWNRSDKNHGDPTIEIIIYKNSW
jgi:hypothetical protein